LAKHDTILFMISVSVVKFRFPDDVKGLDSIFSDISLQKEFSLDVENSPIPQEVATILAFNQGGLLLACIKNKQDLADLMMFLKRDSKILSSLKWKCIVFEDFQPIMLKHALTPLGVTDIFPLSFNVPVVKLKIESFLKTFLLTENLTDQHEIELQEGVAWVEPLNLEADFWLLEDLSQTRKVLNSWVISIQGPSTQIGFWEKVSAQTWAYKVNVSEQEIFGVGGGKWHVKALVIPKLDWKEKRWIIQGNDVELYYQVGEEKFHKIISKERSLEIAKDSLHAQMKRDFILSSFNEKFIFKVESKTTYTPEIEVETSTAKFLELKLEPVEKKSMKHKKLKPLVKSPLRKKFTVQRKDRLLSKRQKALERREEKKNSQHPVADSLFRRRKVISRPNPLPMVSSSEELEYILQEMMTSFEDSQWTDEEHQTNEPSLQEFFKRALEEERLQNVDAAITTHLRCLSIDELFYDSLEHLFYLYDQSQRYEEAFEIGSRIIYNFSLNERISCRVIHLVFILQIYDEILPLSLQILSFANLDSKLSHHLGVGLFLIGRNYLDHSDTIRAFACFDLIAVNNHFLGQYLKHVVLCLLELNRLEEAEVYLEFVEDQTDRLLCSKVGELGLITDVAQFILYAKKVFLEFTDNALKKYLLNKLQLFGFSEEDALQQLEG
jgi:tetratricopeptide (TPR) repeat protein